MKNIADKIKFTNSMPNFNLQGTLDMSNYSIVIVDLWLNCEPQVCSTSIDFYPTWRIDGNKVVLELEPKWIDKNGVEMNVQLFSEQEGGSND